MSWGLPLITRFNVLIPRRSRDFRGDRFLCRA